MSIELGFLLGAGALAGEWEKASFIGNALSVMEASGKNDGGDNGRYQKEEREEARNNKSGQN